LKLDEDDIKILRKEEITGLAFLELTEEKFRSIGFTLGPATTLAKFIEGLSQKLRNYSSLKTLDDLKEMLRRNKVNGEDITSIKQFNTPSMLSIIMKLLLQESFNLPICREKLLLTVFPKISVLT